MFFVWQKGKDAAQWLTHVSSQLLKLGCDPLLPAQLCIGGVKEGNILGAVFFLCPCSMVSLGMNLWNKCKTRGVHDLQFGGGNENCHNQVTGQPGIAKQTRRANPNIMKPKRKNNI